MIEVFIVHDGEALGHIEIERVGTETVPTFSDPEAYQFAEYTVRFGIDRGSAVGVSSRVIHSFERRKYNVFGLVRIALDTLRESEFELERDYDIDSTEASVSADLAGRLRGTVREISRGFSRLHRH